MSQVIRLTTEEKLVAIPEEKAFRGSGRHKITVFATCLVLVQAESPSQNINVLATALVCGTIKVYGDVDLYYLTASNGLRSEDQNDSNVEMKKLLSPDIPTVSNTTTIQMAPVSVNDLDMYGQYIDMSKKFAIQSECSKRPIVFIMRFWWGQGLYHMVLSHPQNCTVIMTRIGESKTL